MRSLFADDVGPGGQRLPEFDCGGTNRAKCACIIRHLWLNRPKARDAAQPLDLGRGVTIRLNGAKSAVARKNAAPFEQANDMGNGTSHGVRG